MASSTKNAHHGKKTKCPRLGSLTRNSLLGTWKFYFRRLNLEKATGVPVYCSLLEKDSSPISLILMGWARCYAWFCVPYPEPNYLSIATLYKGIYPSAQRKRITKSYNLTLAKRGLPQGVACWAECSSCGKWGGFSKAMVKKYRASKCRLPSGPQTWLLHDIGHIPLVI